jgi:hypothetical protein
MGNFSVVIETEPCQKSYIVIKKKIKFKFSWLQKKNWRLKTQNDPFAKN